MQIPQDKVPCDLDEAVDLLMESLTGLDIAIIKNKESSSSNYHFEVGTELRNEWSIWDKDTILVKWFFKTYGIEEADDISAIILECLWNDVRQEKRRDIVLSMRLKSHSEKIRNQKTNYD